VGCGRYLVVEDRRSSHLPPGGFIVYPLFSSQPTPFDARSFASQYMDRSLAYPGPLLPCSLQYALDSGVQDRHTITPFVSEEILPLRSFDRDEGCNVGGH
jgi:hypothetical protein